MKKRNHKERKPIDTTLLRYLLIECFAVILLFSICMYGAGSIVLGQIVYFGYIVIGVLLLALAVGLNGGFDTELPGPEDITGNLSLEQREKIVEKLRRRKELAKRVLFLDFPILLCLLFDTIYVMLPTGGPL